MALTEVLKTPQVIITDPSFVTPPPSFAADSQVRSGSSGPPARYLLTHAQCWSILIESQRALVAATQFIIELNHTLRARASTLYIPERMKKLDAWVRAVMEQLNTPPTPTNPLAGQSYDSEDIVAQSIRAICRIKLCR
jgi:hypothetical protein